MIFIIICNSSVFAYLPKNKKLHLMNNALSIPHLLAIAMALMSSMRRGPCIHKLLLYYPVTNACFDTPSYRQFAADYYLYREGMKWFWRQYSCKAPSLDFTSDGSPTQLTHPWQYGRHSFYIKNNNTNFP